MPGSRYLAALPNAGALAHLPSRSLLSSPSPSGSLPILEVIDLPSAEALTDLTSKALPILVRLADPRSGPGHLPMPAA